MPLSPEELRDRFRATLLGCAIGDALGFPFEGAPPEAIARVPLLAEDFAARPRGRFAKGQYTDDTQLTVALAESVISERKVDGRSIAQRFAALWRSGELLEPDRSCSESLDRLSRGVPWMSAGVPIGLAGNSAATRAAPLGLLHYDDLARIPRDSEVQAVITHKDPRSQAGSAAIAAAVALNLTDEPLPSDVWCRRISLVVQSLDKELASEIERLAQLVRFDPTAAVKVIARAGLPCSLSQRDWPGISPFVVPSVMMALYAFLRERDDFRACVTIALRAGGDADSVAAMAGAVSGAHLGCMGLPARLRKGVLNGDYLVMVADRLYDLKAAQREAPLARVSTTLPSRKRER